MKPLVLRHDVLRLRALNPRYSGTNKIRINARVQAGKRIGHVEPQDAVTERIPNVVRRSIHGCVPGVETNLRKPFFCSLFHSRLIKPRACH